jgi:dihydrofolate synthase / folylpolyglutamate synthase
MMGYEETIEYLYNRGFFTVKFGLDGISNLVKEFNNPQNNYKTIHIAGTNGKGSTSSFISSMLIKQGYKVGVYTSPHLVDFRERIKINFDNIPKQELVKIIKQLKPYVKKQTFFEIVTAAAFIYFSNENVDFAIIEVGMGGRLDATNIITPEVSVITNISMEHTAHLGDTIEKISNEKGGIIKPNIPVVTSPNGKAFEIIKSICSKNNSELIVIEENGFDLGMKGSFQRENAMLAVEAINILKKNGIKINKESINFGLKNAKWPGRMDFIKENVLFDCAHNPNGAKTLVKELKLLGFEDVILIIGIMKDKDIKHMVKEFEKCSNEIIVTKPNITRGEEPQNIAKYISKKYIIMPSIKKALSYAMEISEDKLIVLSGSIFTVGEGFEALSLEPFNPKVN